MTAGALGAGRGNGPDPVRVHRVSAERRADFDRLLGDPASCSGCWCAAWSVPTWDAWGDRTPEQNRSVRDGIFDAARWDGYLAYRGATPVGWCQAGPVGWWPKLQRQFDLGQGPGDYAATCLMVLPAHRRTGVASALVDYVLDDLTRRGARRILAFPRVGPGLDEAALWNGPYPLWESRGFTPVRAVGPRMLLERLAR